MQLQILILKECKLFNYRFMRLAEAERPLKIFSHEIHQELAASKIQL